MEFVKKKWINSLQRKKKTYDLICSIYPDHIFNKLNDFCDWTQKSADETDRKEVEEGPGREA